MAADPHPPAASLRLPDGTVIRPFSERSELEECVELQRRVWGEGFADVASPAIVKIVQTVGGVAAGAFDPGGPMLGFVFGITGLADGEPVHWSHMLAVLPEARGRDLGYQLKLYQRRRLFGLGVERALWTYDPLVAKNAYLNLVRLGARPLCYVRDYYGEGGDNALSAGIGTDRFIVEWAFGEERVVRRLEGGGAEGGAVEPPEAYRAAPVMNVREGEDPGGGGGEPEVAEPPVAPVVRVEVPEDVQELRRASPERAALWRASTRRAFESLLERGYQVVGFYRESPGQAEDPLKRPSSDSAGEGGRLGRSRGGRAFYVLRRKESR
jgi:predicted GNAT superfamily acetyltransferase